MRQLLKIKVDEDGVLVKYQQTRDSGKTEVVTLEAGDQPRQELEDALAAMAEHLRAICELPEEWQDNIEIRGVTYTRGDVDGCVITGLRALTYSNAPLVLNSPHMTNAPVSETDDSGKGVYSLECGKALLRLEKQAWRYVDGERAQLELGIEPAPEEPAADSPGDPTTKRAKKGSAVA